MKNACLFIATFYPDWFQNINIIKSITSSLSLSLSLDFSFSLKEISINPISLGGGNYIQVNDN